MAIIVANITMGSDRSTQVTGKTIEEIVEKIREYHTITEFEKQHFAKRGTLAKQLKSGWYFKQPGVKD